MSDTLKTITGEVIPEDVRGLFYFCDYNYEDCTLTVKKTVFTKTAQEALDMYANTPNPESQLAIGVTREDFEEEVNYLHARMKDKKWLKQLAAWL